MVYWPGFLDRSRADALFTALWDELAWSQREIVLFGRQVLQPRLVAWYGDPGAVYRYSGLSLEPLRWHPLLEELRDHLQTATAARFNSVLANAYRDGRDAMGWHSDDEKELGPEPLIASLSLGASRRFLMRPKKSSPGAAAVREWRLEHGSLLLMRGSSQRNSKHALPRTARPVGRRINLTYRWVAPQAPD